MARTPTPSGAKQLDQYTLALSEGITLLVLALAHDQPDPGAVLRRIEDMAVEPELDANPVAKRLLFEVAKLTHGYHRPS